MWDLGGNKRHGGYATRYIDEYLSLNYQYQGGYGGWFQGMALSYRRATQSTGCNSPRHTNPSHGCTGCRGRGRPLARRITSILPPQPLPTPSTAAILALQATPRDKEEYTTQLPRTFQHGLPPFSLEPGTVNLEFPPSTLFLSPPLGGRNEKVETVDGDGNCPRG